MASQIGRLIPNTAEISRNRALFPEQWTSERWTPEESGFVCEFRLNPARWPHELLRRWILATSPEDHAEAIIDCDDLLVAFCHGDDVRSCPIGVLAYVWRVWANDGGWEVPGRGRRTVKRVDLDLDYCWVEPQFRGHGVAIALKDAFIDYCCECRVSADWNDELPRNRRIDPKGVLVSVLNRYRWEGERAFGPFVAQTIGGVFGEPDEAWWPAQNGKRPWNVRGVDAP